MRQLGSSTWDGHGRGALGMADWAQLNGLTAAAEMEVEGLDHTLYISTLLRGHQ